MATKKKNNIKRKPAAKKPQAKKANTISRTKQFRLGAGIFFLLVGVFISFSIISYCFTWRADQDKVITGGSFSGLMDSEAMVSNWGGRLGAYISHHMVYGAVGIAALGIGLWIIIIGTGLIYGKRRIAAARYLRWLSILLLVGAPLLTYLLPDAAFAYGGAWGNEAINYMNGFFGYAGTGMILFAVVCFVAFVVFALDISPILRRSGKAVKQMASAAAEAAVLAQESMKQRQQEREERKAQEETSPSPSGEGRDGVSSSLGGGLEEANTAPDDIKPLTNINDDTSYNEDLQVSDKPQTINDLYTQEDNDEDETPPSPSGGGREGVERSTETPERKTPPSPSGEGRDGAASSPGEDLEETSSLSFEVTKKEDEISVPTHGGHISIADNEKYAPELDLPDYKFPTLDLLEEREGKSIVLDKDELEQNKNQIINTLKSFGIEIQRISATVGPTVTLYEIVPAEGVRISKIRNLEDDIALNLAALGIRIIAPIPGRGTIGIEVPNANKQIVSIRQLLSSEKFVNSKMSLPIALGKKIDNENYIVDLATMPHLLMAGATGQGKSVGINTILVSLLYKKHPSQLKFVMVDPKKVELSIYRVIEKHFLAKLPDEEESIITDTKKVINTLNALCIEMDNRYELLKDAGARNIKEYNDKFIRRRLNPENGHTYLPFIVLVIDEFADLMMTAGKEVEMPIARLAQLARAVGIHLIIATQRPSVNVITGIIKANFPARIAFKVSAKVDSRTILDAGGAEQLIGRGDMLISFGSELLRLQCAFVDTPEVDEVVEFIGDQRGYPTAFELPEYEGEESDKDKSVDLTNRDKLFEDCARTVVQTQSGSTSMLQRRFNLGYNRAGRIMDQLEAADIVGPSQGSKPRDVLVKTESELDGVLSLL